jgi:uncharacterized protein (DUF58 family)
LQSRSPLGTLRHSQPIFEDPSRMFGKRDYQAGDSLRRVDWKASGAAGRLQVKLFEPSIALSVMIVLNLNIDEYTHRAKFDAAELAVLTAASLANWAIGQRQAVGLATNGQIQKLPDGAIDSNEDPPVLTVLPPRTRRVHLMRILETLAQVQLGETIPFVSLLGGQLPRLAWGTSLIVITPQVDDALFERLFAARRAGIDAALVPCGFLPQAEAIRRKAERFGFPFQHIFTERDLDVWR